MEAWVRLALVLIGTAVYNCASQQAPPESSQDPTTLTEALAAYNRAPEVTSVFRLYEADPETKQETSTSSRQLRFTIKETVCPKQSETQPRDKCAFKESGALKDCTATISEELGNKALVVFCDTIITKAPVRRPRQVRHCIVVNNKQRCRVIRPSVGSSLSVVDKHI